MSAQHTPGPWTADIGRVGSTFGTQAAIRVGDGILGNTFALVVLGGPGATSKQAADILANARLIAAAPDLLEAARRALVLHEDAACSCEGCLMLRAAIAKAEGGGV